MDSSGKIEVLEQSATRFQLSNEGWTRMNAGRSAADLIREAISNTFDADGVTSVKVELQPGMAIIEDDSPQGIGDFNLVTTVFLTDKSDSPKKRGRKGRGLKELISAAETAQVETIGHSVLFTEGRLVVKNERTRGTKVIVYVKGWGEKDVVAARAYLHRVIPPPGVKFSVNGVTVSARRVRNTFRYSLATQVVTDGVQRDTYESTDVHVVNLAKGETQGWIYEMGIPVQAIKTKFHVDVQQRIPLNDNRDTVDSYFLSNLYGNLLSSMIDGLSRGALKQEWAQAGIHHVYDTSVKQKVVRKMYGDLSKLAIKTNNKAANDLAKVHGYELVDIASLSRGMEDVVTATVSTADKVASLVTKSQPDVPVEEAMADPSGKLAALVKFLGVRLLGTELSTHFFARERDYTGMLKKAHYDSANKRMGFNVLAELPLQNPLDNRILSVITHELAHFASNEHDEAFHEEVEALAGRLASLFLHERDAILQLVNQTPPSTSKKLTITCIDCGGPREIYPQDAHQVKRCVPCTKKARRQRAKDRANGV